MKNCIHGVDDKKVVIGKFFDMSKAFDTSLAPLVQIKKHKPYKSYHQRHMFPYLSRSGLA
ncbi:hypothetical protein J6590_078258 [Homalodisca vitripennis]|nr:hypothetical protein J6590_078258 [Homalodisca vitripennis]